MPLTSSGAGLLPFADKLPVVGSTGGIGLEIPTFFMVKMAEFAMWAL